jgi:hypothetical protein
MRIPQRSKTRERRQRIDRKIHVQHFHLWFQYPELNLAKVQ